MSRGPCVATRVGWKLDGFGWGEGSEGGGRTGGSHRECQLSNHLADDHGIDAAFLAVSSRLPAPVSTTRKMVRAFAY